MEEKIISEEQLEIMRHKARKRQNIAIVLTFLAFVLYIGMFYVALIEKEGMSVLFVVKIVFAAAVLAIATFGLLWYIVVPVSYTHLCLVLFCQRERSRRIAGGTAQTSECIFV